ncbi:MAG: hypothetical protein OS112_01560 [Methanoregula sp.]|nr:MAG: hypothetical protein OS112_01560 [Methanoregula sp.]
MENVEVRRAETGECRKSSDLRHEKTKKVFEEPGSSTEVQITLIFLGAGILAYVVIPGFSYSEP